MKTTITIDAPQNKIDLLIAIAREMGISVVVSGEYKVATDEITLVSEASLSEAWDSEEDTRWDTLYSSK